MPEITSESQVTIREITKDTVRSICDLSKTLTPVHQRMVATNAESIAEAYYEKNAWFRAIYANETPVGFIMLYDDPVTPEYFLWRLMIASPYHGMGYGEKAMHLLMSYVKTRPGAKELLVSCEEGEGSPEGFYARLGFKRTGAKLDDEVVLSLALE